MNIGIQRIAECGLFTPWTDPVSGIESWVLTHEAAPYQSSFYFTHPSFTPDGRYYWFYVAYPPSGNHNYGRMLARIDFDTNDVMVFPETAFLDGSPFIDSATGYAYWCTGDEIWKRGPGAIDKPELVNRFPAELSKGRRLHRLATHLTLSADRKSLAIDTEVGLDWFVGDAPLDGSPMRIWERFDRCFNHAQFSPTDPDLILLGQDHWIDPLGRGKGSLSNRLWTVRRGASAKPVMANGTHLQTHEWWHPDGRHAYMVDYQKGTLKVDIAQGDYEVVWPGGTCHSHASRDARYFVGDIGPYDWKNGCRVTFYKAETGKEVNIASAIPEPSLGRSHYHTDPHPQFCLNDTLIVYTTTVLGCVTVAVTDVSALAEATS